MNILEPIKHIFYACGNYPARRVEKVAFKRAHRSAAKVLKNCPQPPLTAAQIEEIDRYWQRYGIKHPDYTWFQMFYGITGIQDPRFIPDTICQSILLKHYNDIAAIPGWDDKNLYDTLLPDIRFPKTMAHIYRGKVFDDEWNYCDEEGRKALAQRIFDSLGDDKTIVAKQTRNTNTGRGVKLVEVNSPNDVLDCITANSKGNVILQERLHQSAFLSQFCASSVNIFRVITWKHGDTVDVLSASVRFGIEGWHTDVAFVNGVEIVNSVGVDNDGKVKDLFVSMQGLYDREIHLTQPVTPNFDAIIDMAKRGHRWLKPFDIVSWDISQDQDNNPVCIEFNVTRPGTTLYQFANGPFAGELTEDLLAFMLDKDFPRKSIPKNYRLP